MDEQAAPENKILGVFNLDSNFADALNSTQLNHLERGKRNPNAMGHSDMRTSNMSLILKYLREHGNNSRAALVEALGLSKASVSSLVNELLERGLVYEESVDRRGKVGRPGTYIAISGSHVCAIGIEINVEYISVVVTDLSHQIRYADVQKMPFPLPAKNEVIKLVAAQIRMALSFAKGANLWVCGIGVASPGIIDYDQRSIRYASSLNWHEVQIAELIKSQFAAPVPEILLENDAKLAALAAYSQVAKNGDRDVVYLTGDVGVGAGIIADGKLLKGWSGFSGEVGHLTIFPQGKQCTCGRRGCWELYVGVNNLFQAGLKDKIVADETLPMLERLERVKFLLTQKDESIIKALDELAEQLSLGLSIITDVLNPRTVVLGGYFAMFADHLIEQLTNYMQQRLIDPGGTVKFVAAEHGVQTPALGGALLALNCIYQNPMLAERPVF